MQLPIKTEIIRPECGHGQLLTEYPATVQSPQQPPAVNERVTAHIRGDFDGNAGVAFEFPDNVVSATLKGEGRLYQSKERQNLALKAAQQPAPAA